MKIAPFLIARRSMHWEHAEHHRQHRTIRLEGSAMRNITVVVRCSGVFKIRLRLAMWLMRLAGRIGGFKQIKLIREK